MKIEVGMYVRSSKGEIEKINSLAIQESNPLFPYRINCKARFGHDVKKASHNIIDLIEKLDVIEFINGSVLRVESISDRYICFLSKDDDCAGIFFDKETLIKDIKSIVTKEQFAQTEYKVGE